MSSFLADLYESFRTCHAAIIARELGIPAVVGCGDATDKLKDGQLVTVACSEGDTGYIYDGLLETEVSEVHRGELPYCPIKIMMNVGNPQLAFNFAQMPSGGVGLARLEFIINNNIGVHPKAILDYPNIDADLKKAVESVARGHASPRAFYVDKLAEGIATIAAAFSSNMPATSPISRGKPAAIAPQHSPYTAAGMILAATAH